MTIYSDFKPTYLYIKQHSITGKLYFGMTIQNPEKYIGSGLYWKRHIKEHGREYVVNLWYCLFIDRESCTEFALNFSKQQNIVDSDEWLNLRLENGLDGASEHSIESRNKMREAKLGKSTWNKGISMSDSTKEKLSNIMKVRSSGRKHSPETIEKLRNNKLNKNHNKGRLWWTNGSQNIMSEICPSPEYKRGRCNFRKTVNVNLRRKLCR